MTRGARAALANAQRLLTDAQALLALDSAPTAYSLAILAIEEASKANDWHRIAAEHGDAPMNSSPKQHKDRLRAVRQGFNYLQVFHDLIDDPDGYNAEAEESWLPRLEAEISKDNAMKQRGFYVDVDGDVVLEPSLISGVQARAIIEDAGQAIALMRSLMESNGQGAEGSS